MSKDEPASVIELSREFDRAMVSLTREPIDYDEPEDWLSMIQDHYYDGMDMIGTDEEISDATFADNLLRIGAIALEGAARLRRAK